MPTPKPLPLENLDQVRGAVALLALVADMIEAAGKNAQEEKQWYTTKDLVNITGFSESWMVKWRHKIVSAEQVGRLWRFNKAIIDRRIAAGKSIIEDGSQPGRRRKPEPEQYLRVGIKYFSTI